MIIAIDRSGEAIEAEPESDEVILVEPFLLAYGVLLI